MSELELHIVGVDLAKSVFHAHGVDREGRALLQKKLTQPQFEAFLADLPACIVAIEACASSHYWGRISSKQGHDARLIPVHRVKPFVRRHKNDAIDAAVIAMAAAHPSTQAVTVKTENQQAQAMLFRSRALFISQRVQLTNALRGHFAEHGIVLPQTGRHTRGFLEKCWEVLEAVPLPVAQLARSYMRQIESIEIEIGILDVKIKRRALQNAGSKPLQTMPGIGPQAALAVHAVCPPAEHFRTGRDFAAWLGLVPRQHSIGGKDRLGRITRMGQRAVRRLLILGASSVIAASERNGRCDDPWLDNMLRKKAAARGRRCDGQSHGATVVGDDDDETRLRHSCGRLNGDRRIPAGTEDERQLRNADRRDRPWDTQNSVTAYVKPPLSIGTPFAHLHKWPAP